MWLPIHIHPISQLQLSSRSLMEIEPSWSNPFPGNRGICPVFPPSSIFFTLLVLTDFPGNNSPLSSCPQTFLRPPPNSSPASDPELQCWHNALQMCMVFYLKNYSPAGQRSQVATAPGAQSNISHQRAEWPSFLSHQVAVSRCVRDPVINRVKCGGSAM